MIGDGLAVALPGVKRAFQFWVHGRRGLRAAGEL